MKKRRRKWGRHPTLKSKFKIILNVIMLWSEWESFGGNWWCGRRASTTSTMMKDVKQKSRVCHGKRKRYMATVRAVDFRIVFDICCNRKVKIRTGAPLRSRFETWNHYEIDAWMKSEMKRESFHRDESKVHLSGGDNREVDATRNKYISCYFRFNNPQPSGNLVKCRRSWYCASVRVAFVV